MTKLKPKKRRLRPYEKLARSIQNQLESKGSSQKIMTRWLTKRGNTP